MDVGQPRALVEHRHAEQAPAAPVSGEGGFLGVLALETHGEVFSGGDGALVDTDAEVAVPGGEDGGHYLLSFDHLAEEGEVVDLPGEFAGEDVRRGVGVAGGEGEGLVEDEDVGGDEEGVGAGCEEGGEGGGGGEVAPAMGLLLGGEAVPGVAVDGFGVVEEVDDGEAIAGEAVPLVVVGGAGVDDLEVDGEVAGEGLGVSFGVDEEAAVVAADVEVA